jgi:uncharacterized membrane protein YbhN (UPF0104 family)
MLEVLAPLEAARPLAGHLAAVSLLPLALGIACQFLKLATLGCVWLRILRAALPGVEIRARDALTPYLAGTAANAVLPAKAGLATRVVLARRLIPEATYEALAGTMVAESLLGLPPMLMLFAVAGATGLLSGAMGGSALAVPAWMVLPGGWIAGVAAAGALALIALLAVPRVRGRAAEAFARLRQGMRILGEGRDVRPALLGQFAAWALRLASIACFLAAFGVTPTPGLVVLVVLAQILAGLVPITPSGAGAQQGLIVVALAGAASTSTALAFGVGMQAAVLVADVLAGVAALALSGAGSAIGHRLGPVGLAEAPAAAGGG